MIYVNGYLLNRKTKHGWRLSGHYLQYREDGGYMTPEAWNQRIYELN